VREARGAAPGPARRGSGRAHSAQSRRTTRTGLLLVAPALLFVGVFALYPLIFGVYISLTNWPLVGPYHFIGLANYSSLVHNSVFLQSILFTLKYTAIVTIPIFVVGYALAVFVRSNRPGSTVFRTMIFVPFIVGLVAESFMAVVEFQPSSGTANFVLSKLGIVSSTTAWLVHTDLALTAISVLVIWFASGLTMMLLMDGMQGINREYYECADLDGAGWWKQEREITIPILRRTIAMAVIISVIGSLLAFSQFYILTRGGPYDSTQVLPSLAFFTGILGSDLAEGAAISIFLVPLLVLVSWLVLRSAHRAEGA